MTAHSALKSRRLLIVLAAGGLVTSATLVSEGAPAGRSRADSFDPLLTEPGRACGPAQGGQPALLKVLILAKADAAPAAAEAAKAAQADVPLYKNLGSLGFKVSTRRAGTQAYFDQGLRLAFGFNHAEAQRAFQAAQRLDPDCAMCFWGESLVLGPNINVPMMPEANATALAALAKAVALKGRANGRERALIEALEQRYSADPKAERATLDGAYADAMKRVAERFQADDTIQVLFAEASMDTQPWDYWEAGGARPKGRGQDIVTTLERVLNHNPTHPGAIHLYIHAMEASTVPEKALPYANRLAALVPGAGHLVHMPAHIYYRVGMYREALQLNRRAVDVDERYFKTSPSDPLYKAAYYPHNIHFVMVSSQMGGDGRTAIEAATKLDASVPAELVKLFPILQPIKSAPYATHARFSDPDTILRLPAPSDDVLLVKAMYHYARAVALATRQDAAGARQEIDALAKMETTADFKPFEPWGVPAKDIVQTARLVATGRLADASGDLDGAAKAYEEAVKVEDGLSYTEPPYWYYPVRQSLGAVRLRQGRLDDAERAFRDSLARVRNNGWALAGLVEVQHKKGDAKAERIAREAYRRAWFGPTAGPDIAKL